MSNKIPAQLDDALVRAKAFEIGVLADQILGCRGRLQEACDALYPQLRFADPSTDQAFERFLTHLCRSLNELHNLHAVKTHAETCRRFRMPPEPAQVPQGMQTPSTDLVPA